MVVDICHFFLLRLSATSAVYKYTEIYSKPPGIKNTKNSTVPSFKLQQISRVSFHFIVALPLIQANIQAKGIRRELWSSMKLRCPNHSSITPLTYLEFILSEKAKNKLKSCYNQYSHRNFGMSHCDTLKQVEERACYCH
jgi:hypothetical protein